MNKNQFKALMADNERILIFVDEAIQSNLTYSHTLILGLSLAFLFTALKLEGIIAWSWLWVLAPGWLLYIGVIIWTIIISWFQSAGIKDLKQKRHHLIKSLIKEE